MPLVAGHQVVGARGVGALQKLVVVRVPRHLERACGPDGVRTAPDELKKLLAQALADFQFRPREYFPVFRKNGVGNVQSGWFRDRKQEDGALESVRFEGGRDDKFVSITSRRGIIWAWAFERAPP